MSPIDPLLLCNYQQLAIAELYTI